MPFDVVPSRYRAVLGSRLSRWSLCSALAVGFSACAAAPRPAPAAVQAQDQDADSVRAVVAAVAHHIDGKDWEALRGLYAERVRTDYTSLFGGAPVEQTGEALIAGWRGVLTRVETQHLLGPIVVDIAGASAVARCHVRALHVAAGAASGDSWEVLGHYVFELERSDQRWMIRKMTLEASIQRGNPKLLEEANAGR